MHAANNPILETFLCMYKLQKNVEMTVCFHDRIIDFTIGETQIFKLVLCWICMSCRCETGLCGINLVALMENNLFTKKNMFCSLFYYSSPPKPHFLVFFYDALQPNAFLVYLL